MAEARSEHVGLTALHLDRMPASRFKHVGLTTLHVARIGESRFEHVGFTTHLAEKVLQRFQSLLSKI